MIIISIIFAVLEVPALVIIGFVPAGALRPTPVLAANTTVVDLTADTIAPIASEPAGESYLEDKYLHKTAEELDAQAQAESDWIASQPGYSDNADPYGEDTPDMDQPVAVSADGIPIKSGLGFYIDAGAGWVDMFNSAPTAMLVSSLLFLDYQRQSNIDPLCFFSETDMFNSDPIVLQGSNIVLLLKLPEYHPVFDEQNQILRSTLTLYPLVLCNVHSDITAADKNYACYQKDAVTVSSEQTHPDEYFRIEINNLPQSPSGLYALDYTGSLTLFQQPGFESQVVTEPTATESTAIIEFDEDIIWGPDRDHDGLTNDQERALGTDINDPDTDDDGTSDGVDEDPLDHDVGGTGYPTY